MVCYPTRVIFYRDFTTGISQLSRCVSGCRKLGHRGAGEEINGDPELYGAGGADWRALESGAKSGLSQHRGGRQSIAGGGSLGGGGRGALRYARRGSDNDRG